MSYPDAPPVRQGRHPMFYVGMGCLVLFCIGMVGCIALGFTAYKVGKEGMEAVQKAAKTPVPLETVQAGLGDVPVYPNAKYADSEASRTARAGIRFLMEKLKAARSVEVAQFTVADAPEKTLAWYDAKLKAAGYEVSGTRSGQRKNRDPEAVPVKQYVHTYKKGDTVVIASYDLPEESKIGSLMLMRFDGISENFRAESFGNGGNFDAEAGAPTGDGADAGTK
jgi:hypothetical protein